MKHFNNLKNQLRQEKHDLPEGLDWQSMEDGIFDKMGDGPRSGIRSSWIVLKLFLGSMIVVSGALLWITQITDEEKQLAEAASVNIVSNNQKKNSNPTNHSATTPING